MELKEITQGLEAFKAEAKGDIEAQKNALADLQTKFDTFVEDKGIAKAEDIDAIKADFAKLAADFAEKGDKEEPKKKSFKGSFSEALGEVKSELKSHAASSSRKLDMSLELKDMDFDNFSEDALASLTTQTLPGIYRSPWGQLWLRNILPRITTTSKIIDYIKEDETANESAGAADIWDGDVPIDELLAKPDVDFNFTDASAAIHWIAGITRIKREMLEDIPFLNSYIPQQLVYGKRGIFIRENAMILSTLNSNSVAYDGSATKLVEKIYDAAFGQLLDNYHAPTHILMNNRDVVSMVLNKATGSGEYDLPPGTVSNAAGQLTIGGIPVIGLPQFETGTAFVIDATQTLFASRMEPEVRVFEEDRDNVIKNLITFRAEERAGVVPLSNTANIKVEA